LSGAEEPEEALPGPVCPICKGTGFVHPRLPSGKPDYSRTVPCSCTLQKREREHQSQLRKYSGLEAKLLKNMTFDNFNREGLNPLPEQRENLKEAFRLAFEFAKSPDGWLIFAGFNGCGKTHLAAAIANHCIENNRPVFYITTPDLLDYLRSSFNPNSDMPYDEFFEQVRNTPLLILDDLGAQSSTPWAKEKLDQLLNHRFNNQLPTVIVSI